MTTQRTEKQYGFVALFDVLGYQQIISNDDVESTARMISKELLSAPKAAVEHIKKKYEGHAVIQNQISHLVFSDTILVTMNFPLKETTAIDWMYFGSLCTILFRRLFYNGLPLRGAISVGDFYIHDEEKCFAGKPIVEAYKSSTFQDWSGCVLTESATREFHEHLGRFEHGPRSIIHDMIISYPVPLKDGQAKTMCCLNWEVFGIFSDGEYAPTGGNVRDVVFNSFLEHGKHLEPPAQQKAHNTEVFIRQTRLESAKHGLVVIPESPEGKSR